MPPFYLFVRRLLIERESGFSLIRFPTGYAPRRFVCNSGKTNDLRFCCVSPFFILPSVFPEKHDESAALEDFAK